MDWFHHVVGSQSSFTSSGRLMNWGKDLPLIPADCVLYGSSPVQYLILLSTSEGIQFTT